MKTQKDLQEKIRGIDGKGYKAYKEITGEFDFSDFSLRIDHVQGDPFSTPSRMRVRVARASSGFDADLTACKSRAIGFCDFLARVFYYQSKRISKGNRGIGNGGVITVEKSLQEILERTTVVANDRFVEARIFMGLPAVGRRISGGDAAAMLFEELPEIVRSSLFAHALDAKKMRLHVGVAEDADFIRGQLADKGLLGFVANGACLPRASGIDPEPLAKEKVILFQSPARFQVSFYPTNHGKIEGMGIPKGITLIVGGGYHGKSTLLNALERGVYNHIPGDGREYVIMDAGAVKIRAADGRSVQQTDISPFIQDLPFSGDTRSFSTANASGSTSQAAAISEALEMGTTCLLLDEDTSATNFMIRDARMQQLVPKVHEPITPFIDKVRFLSTERDVSTILVMGGSGDYFSVADHVIRMIEYRPEDATEKAHEIAARSATGRIEEGGKSFGELRTRIPEAESLSPVRDNGRVKISARGRNQILFGESVVDCTDVEQIVETAQTRAIALAIRYAARYMDGKQSMTAVLANVMRDLDQGGLDILSPFITGDLACFRRFELAAAINRMRTLRMAR